MKAHAFKCDFCGKIVERDEVEGVSPQDDIFDKLNSYPIIHNPDKASIHFCTSHYSDHVTGPASSQHDRRISEEAYTMKIKELAYDLRKTTVERHRAFTLARKAKKK